MEPVERLASKLLMEGAVDEVGCAVEWSIKDAIWEAMKVADIRAISWFPSNDAPVAEESEGWGGD